MTVRKFIYRTHGLCVASPFELPSAFALAGDHVGMADVRVSMMDPDAAFPATATLFRGEGAGIFAVSDGAEIRIRPDRRARPRLLSSHVLGSGLGRILQQRGALVLHAAGVLGPHGVVMIMGASGAGKSTLASCIATHGIATVGDDVLGLWPDRQYGIAASDICFKLTREALDMIGLGGADRDLDPVAQGIPKYHVQIGPSAPAGYHRPVAAVLLETGPKLALSRLDPLAALAALDAQRYRPEFQESQERPALFRHIAGLVDRIPVYRLSRPQYAGVLQETARQVLAVLADPKQRGDPAER